MYNNNIINNIKSVHSIVLQYNWKTLIQNYCNREGGGLSMYKKRNIVAEWPSVKEIGDRFAIMQTL